MTGKQKITPCLWFAEDALEPAEFYVSVFPNSRIVKVSRAPTDYPGGKAGDVLLVDFSLAGQSYQALKGGPHHQFNDAISLSVDCADQAELDHYWNGLVAGGGEFVQCGWLKDRYGVSWQVVPEVMDRLMSGGTPAQSKRVMEAMMQMVKLDIDALQRAYDGAE